MAAIYTYPDFSFNPNIKKILVTNADWTNEEIQNIVDQISDKEYEIYLVPTKVPDVQWAEGVRASANKNYNWKHITNKTPLDFIKELDNGE